LVGGGVQIGECQIEQIVLHRVEQRWHAQFEYFQGRAHRVVLNFLEKVRNSRLLRHDGETNDEFHHFHDKDGRGSQVEGFVVPPRHGATVSHQQDESHHLCHEQ